MQDYSSIDDSEICTLQSCEGVQYKVEVKVARMSNTIKGMICDAGVDEPLPLVDIKAKTLEKVVEYCRTHSSLPAEPPAQDADLNVVPLAPKPITVDDMEFCQQLSHLQILEVLLAANYLEIPSLLDLCARYIAHCVVGKTPKEIRDFYNIKKEFTKEQYETAKKENSWCVENP